MGLVRTATVTSVGLACKTALNVYLSRSSVHGMDNLLAALDSSDRQNGRGIITVANHISTLDDPVSWGFLPWRCYLSEKRTRWALGASDVMFTNPVFSSFFRAGQVLETFRGRGVYQKAVDQAIEKLDDGGWAHVFGEGKVRQTATYDEVDGRARLIRFKWGVGRMLMEARRPPVVIPMWLSGFDQLMPEGRRFPFKYIPRPGVAVNVTFGTPIPDEKVAALLSTPASMEDGGDSLQAVRSALTALVQEEVEALGRRVAGELLGKR